MFYRAALCFVWFQDKILLIEHKPRARKRRIWRHHVDKPFWTLPGGKQEPNDTDMLATARREVLEETGIATKEIGLHIGTIHFSDPIEGWSCEQQLYQLEAINDTFVAVNDPDDDIFQARFFSKDDAVIHLQNLRVPCMREPMLAVLNDHYIAQDWTYELTLDGDHISKS